MSEQRAAAKREIVTGAVERARVMVVVIGPTWLNTLDHRGNPRLADADDLHRVEIRTALERQIPIVPVLVGGVKMPRRDELPPDIQLLSQMLAVEFTDQRWDYDAQRLSDTIARLLYESR